MTPNETGEPDLRYQLVFQACPHPYLLLKPDADFTIAAANDRYLEATPARGGRPYALILMDMQMPEMGGIEATLAIRAMPQRDATPILALTANAFNEDREHCLAAGMNDFIGKPFDPETLFAMLLKWLEARRTNPAGRGFG